MIVECIFVGTELLLGEILNTNAQFISRRLSELGIDCYHQVTVGDNPVRLAGALRMALGRSDVVVTTGGLGPTLDDLTKETVADVLGQELVLHEPSWEHIVSVFRRRGREPAESNRKQAYFPAEATVLFNARGTAPGMIARAGDKAVIVLPGPPRELQPMFEEAVVPWLQAQLGPAHEQLFTRVIHVAGLGESDLYTVLEDMFASPNGYNGVWLAPYAQLGEVHIRLSTKAPTAAEAAPLLAAAEAAVGERLPRYVYGSGDVTLSGIVGQISRERGWRIATAESCTGGLLAKRLTDTPGSSDYFVSGVVTYSNESKIQMLGVPADVLDAHGAVSDETATAMAVGVCRLTNADVGVSITGIAGPDGGTDAKPVGTVHISVATPDATQVRGYLLRSDDRNTVRQLAAQEALRRLWRTLTEGAD